MANRVVHIDIAKGISIILVVLHHSELRNFAPDIVDSMGLFRMPLFFFLSGVFFNAASSPSAFLRHKADALLKPYFFTLFILFGGSILLNEEHLVWQFKCILYGVFLKWPPLWFLTHLFAIYCFAYVVFRVIGIQKRSPMTKCVFLLMLIAIGSAIIDVFWRLNINVFGTEIELLGLPFKCDVIFISASFFLLGTFLKELIANFTPKSSIVFSSVLIFIAVATLTDAHINFHGRIYRNPLFATLGATCGIYFILSLSFYLNKLELPRNVLRTFGEASLFVLIFHYWIEKESYKLLNSFIISELDWLGAILAFLIGITFPFLVRFIVSKSKFLSLFYFPSSSHPYQTPGFRPVAINAYGSQK